MNKPMSKYWPFLLLLGALGCASDPHSIVERGDKLECIRPFFEIKIEKVDIQPHHVTFEFSFQNQTSKPLWIPTLKTKDGEEIIPHAYVKEYFGGSMIYIEFQPNLWTWGDDEKTQYKKLNPRSKHKWVFTLPCPLPVITEGAALPHESFCNPSSVVVLQAAYFMASPDLMNTANLKQWPTELLQRAYVELRILGIRNTPENWVKMLTQCSTKEAYSQPTPYPIPLVEKTEN